LLAAGPHDRAGYTRSGFHGLAPNQFVPAGRKHRNDEYPSRQNSGMVPSETVAMTSKHSKISISSLIREMSPDDFDRWRDETQLTDEAIAAARAFGLDEYEIAALQEWEIYRSDPGKDYVEKIYVDGRGQFKVEHHRDLKSANDGIVDDSLPKGWDAADVWSLRCSRY
jgi:hypothetical protein